MIVGCLVASAVGWFICMALSRESDYQAGPTIFAGCAMLLFAIALFVALCKA